MYVLLGAVRDYVCDMVSIDFMSSNFDLKEVVNCKNKMTDYVHVEHLLRNIWPSEF